MVNSETMDKLNELGFGANIDAFEDYMEQLMDAYAMGEPMVDDSAFDAMKKLLQQIKPDSKVLLRNNETEEVELNRYDKILEEYGMSSIHTIDGISRESLSNMIDVIELAGGKADLFASLKQNGHATRAVYNYGRLVGGTTRGRYRKGRDISAHLKHMLPNEIEGFKSMPLVELRGEAVVTKTTFDEKLKATGLKTPLSSVTSMLRDSATDYEMGLLQFIGYKCLPSEKEFRPKTLSSEYAILEKCGIKTPPHVLIKGVTADSLVETINYLVEYFEDVVETQGYDIDCDGIVVAVDNNDIFYLGGRDGNAWKGNCAVKEGRIWQSSIYESTIIEVQFKYGKKYITPVAIIEPVVCKNGATVTNVPLYNVGVMDRYGLFTGQSVHFRFGGETGVTLCDEFGNSVRVSE